jgi:hypothetical protein
MRSAKIKEAAKFLAASFVHENALFANSVMNFSEKSALHC